MSQTIVRRKAKSGNRITRETLVVESVTVGQWSVYFRPLHIGDDGNEQWQVEGWIAGPQFQGIPNVLAYVSRFHGTQRFALHVIQLAQGTTTDSVVDAVAFAITRRWPCILVGNSLHERFRDSAVTYGAIPMGNAIN